MELRKTNERWNRPFDESGQEGTSKLESAQFEIKDNDGNVIGNASIGQMGGNVHINFPAGGDARIDINGYGSVEDGVARMKTVLGIAE